MFGSLEAARGSSLRENKAIFIENDIFSYHQAGKVRFMELDTQYRTRQFRFRGFPPDEVVVPEPLASQFNPSFPADLFKHIELDARRVGARDKGNRQRDRKSVV